MRPKYFLTFILIIFWYQIIFTQTPFINSQTAIGTTTEINGGLMVKGQNQLFLQSPSGLCWAIKVNDSGVLETEAVLCDSYQELNVTLRDIELYQYVIPIGDEEGAEIQTQANHFFQSEILNDASTNWQSTYFYRPQAGFSGQDQVTLAIYTGSDGASPNTHVEYLTIYFNVHD